MVVPLLTRLVRVIDYKNSRALDRCQVERTNPVPEVGATGCPPSMTIAATAERVVEAMLA